MISFLGNFIEERPLLLPSTSDLSGFLNLLLQIVNSQSLTISIPLLHTWVKLLRSDLIGGSDLLNPLVGPLLETCSQRLIRYESFPEDSDDPTCLFLNEDIETQPERHAFLGNYRRYGMNVVKAIVRRKPFEAVYHILGQVEQSMWTIQKEQHFDGRWSASHALFPRTSSLNQAR
jgi:exportin-5